MKREVKKIILSPKLHKINNGDKIKNISINVVNGDGRMVLDCILCKYAANLDHKLCAGLCIDYDDGVYRTFISRYQP